MEIKRLSSDFLDSNTFVLTKGNECLIIDAGVKIGQIKNFIGNKKVVGVFLTHGHYDHSYYMEEYLKEFKTTVFASKNVISTLNDPKQNYGENFIVKTFDKIILLEGDGEIKCGEFLVKYFSTPGHSKCSMCFKIEDNLFAGDTIFEKGIGRTDLNGGNVKEMVTSLEKIKEIPFKMLYSGHGDASSYDMQGRNLNAYLRYLTRK